ncbi:MULTISPECIES: LTA synthase family protein [Dyella]|uniref:LTA synthase family protein n=2 Tax=Dyella TaxID=231454 RepID=A0A4V6N9W0_9GAMM|nr:MULTISPECIES: LTA synthase family protein [Dyella]TBR36119.1 LTA synthase family protein [Dyella terrae]TCI06168.1 LTA synthase family protein [Dyella soli]
MQRNKFRFTRNSAAWLCATLFFAGCVRATAGQEPVFQQQAFILALMLCAFGVLLFAFARIATALVVSGGLFLALSFMSVMKLRYLDSPLMPSDFVYYLRSSLVETLAHYPHLFELTLGIVILVPLMLWLVWRGDRRILAGHPRGKSWLMRLGGMAVCALAFWACLLPVGPFSSVHAKDVWDKLSDDAQLTNFFVNFRDSDIVLPPMTSDAMAEQEWSATAQGLPGAAASTAYPDIIQVLEESTFDPSNYVQCNIPQCRVQMFKADKYTVSTGPMRVHTFGGGTWVSEFAALTGMPQDIFGTGGMYAPYVLAPHVRDALPQQLQRLGYLTVAIYPTNGAFLNGRNAYKAYGFDQFYDAKELGLEEWEETDTQMFDAARRIYDKVKKPGQPVFMMILTLAQHGPHDTDPLSSLPAPFNRGLLKDLPAKPALNFNTYLSNLHNSDVAMGELEKHFLDRPEPTVIVHFGDHQPSFGGLIRDMPRTLPPALVPYKHYLTYYMIKSNVKDRRMPSYPMLDIAHLPNMVLQSAGLPMDPYFSAAMELRTRCHGLYSDCIDQDLVKSYHAWTFNHLHVYDP